MLTGQLATVTTKDGLELKGFWIDKKSDIAVFHSHGTAGDFYTHKFIELEGEMLDVQHISFLTANNRGHDVFADIRRHIDGHIEWTQVGGAFEKFEDCILDISAWIDFLERQGIKKVILQAHSLTQKILYYQAIKHDKRVIGQIHISPCNDAGYMYFLLGKEKYEATNTMVAELVKSGNTKELLSSELSVVCPMGPQPYLDYLTEDGIGNLFPYHSPISDKWVTLKETTDPLLMIFGTSDAFIKPSTEEAIQLLRKNAVSSTYIETHLIPNASHSYIGYEENLVSLINNWIAKLLKWYK